MTAACFGKVVFDQKAYILYRQHSANQIGMENRWIWRWRKRILHVTDLRHKLSDQALILKKTYAGLADGNYELHLVCNSRNGIAERFWLVLCKNIYMQNVVDDIIKFSELEEFIDNPVRTYSSGMYMRLAFSVAIHVDADILLIDEILAVGDVNFQKKCFDRLRTLKKEGVTIVIVSHVMEQIRNICSRAVFIEDGCIYKEGKASEIADLYMNKMEQKQLEKIEKDFQNEIAKGRQTGHMMVIHISKMQKRGGCR